MDLPYNWDFLQDNISSEKLAELRRRFMEEWRSGRYTKKQMMERYRMSERTFRNTIRKYAMQKNWRITRTSHGHRTPIGNLRMKNTRTL